MLRRHIIDALHNSDCEINEYNMMRIYLTVRSYDDGLDSSLQKFKIDIEYHIRQSINDEILKLQSFYDFLVFVTPSIVGNPKALNEELDKLCRSNTEKAAMVCILYEYEKYSMSERYSGEEFFERFKDYARASYNLDMFRMISIEESKRLLSSFLYYELNYYPAKALTSKKLNKERLDIQNIISELGHDKDPIQDIRLFVPYLLDLIYSKYMGDKEYKDYLKSLDISNDKKIEKIMRGIYQWNPLSILMLLKGYDDSENDYNLEQTLVYSRLIPLLKECAGSVLKDDTVLKGDAVLKDVTVFNPSIFFVNKLLNDNNLTGINRYRFILSDEEAKFLRTAYKQKYNIIPKSNVAEFMSVKDWNRFKDRNINHHYDTVIYFGNHGNVIEQNKWIQDNIALFSVDTKVALLLVANYANRIIDPIQELFAVNDKMNISKIELMPQGIVNASYPKRKIFVVVDSIYRNEKINVTKFGLHTDENRIQYAKKNQIIDVGKNNIIAGKVSIVKLYNMICLEKTGLKGKRRRKEEYYYSPEITFFYNIMPGDNGCRTCVYHTCERIIEKEDNKGQTVKGNKGKRLIKDKKTEAFRRFDSEDRLNNEFYEWIENAYPFITDKSGVSIRTIISSEIKNSITSKAIEDISLKTFWFIYPELKDKLGRLYDSLKVAASCDLGYFKLSQLDMEQCFFYMNEISDSSNKTTTEVLKALSISLDYACEVGLLKDNKLKAEFSKAEKYERNRISEVRNALVKKTFTAKEIDNQIKYIDNNIGEEWNYFSAMVKMLLPLDTKTVAALKFGDIIHMDDYPGLYKIKISGYVDKDNKVVPFKKIEQYRYLPFPRVLYDRISERINYIKNTRSLSDQEINELYIFTDDGNDSDSWGKAPINPSKLRALWKDVLSSVTDDSNIIELMVNGDVTEFDTSSFGGDIYITNFEYYALNHFGFTMDELAFMKGNKCFSTFARHYNDFNNDASLCGLNVKLHRYEAELFGEDIGYTVRENYINQKDMVISIPEEYKNAAKPIEVNVEITNPKKNVRVDIKNDYGMNVNVSEIKR